MITDSERRLPLSILVIASNEGHQLGRTLGSVQAWAREIVVMINDCTDNTAEVAAAYGARVIERPWTNFRDQKNAALKEVTQPWVLNLDADEVVSQELAGAIAGFVREGTRPAARFARCSWFMGRWIRHGDWYPDHVTRLFQRQAGRWSGTAAHGALEIESGPVPVLHGDLLHYPYATIDDNLRKMIAYTTSYAEEHRDRPFRLWDVLTRPAWRFFRAYFLKRGFLDGFPGFFIAWSTAYMVFVKYTKLYGSETVGAQ